MENLSEKVYECTLGVEAHMICDLLSRAGISARVDGEFLQGAGGDLPLGNAVKVRVDPARAAEAREVIADWEKLQPTEAVAAPAAKLARFTWALWLLGGMAVGSALTFATLASQRRYSTELDRNHDGRIDMRWHYGLDRLTDLVEEDNDFNGRFEWHIDEESGSPVRSQLDADGDGRPERVGRYSHGVLAEMDYYFASGGRVVKREHYDAGLLDWAEFDDDGDGVFDRRVQYDAHAESKL